MKITNGKIIQMKIEWRFFLIWPSKVTTLIVQYHGRELRKRVTLICKKIHVSYQIGRSGSRQSYSRLNTFQNDVVGAG